MPQTTEIRTKEDLYEVSLESFQNTTKTTLIYYYRDLLGEKGYSKYTKGELAQLIYDMCAEGRELQLARLEIERIKLENERLRLLKDERITEEEERKRRESSARLNEREIEIIIEDVAIRESKALRLDHKYTDVVKVNDEKRNLYYKHNAPNIIARTILEFCQKHYEKSTIAKGNTKTLKETLKKFVANDQISNTFREDIMREWYTMVATYNKIEDEKAQGRRDSYEQGQYESEIFDRQRDAIIDWACNVLENPHKQRRYYIAFALMIVSGRRPSEILGNATFEKHESGIGILMTGVAKKKKYDRFTKETVSIKDAEAHFVTLCDEDLFLDVVNSYEERGLEASEVNKKHGSLMSRAFPLELKLQGLKRTYSCRDFYSCLMRKTLMSMDCGNREPLDIVKNMLSHTTSEITKSYKKIYINGLDSIKDKIKLYIDTL